MAHIFQAAIADFRDAVEQAHRACIFQNDFIPIVYNGKVFAGAMDLVREPLPTISAADFVMNMEALGVRFWILKTPAGEDRLLQPEGYHMLPAHWIPRAEALRVAFPVERDAEAVAFMRERGDLAVGEKPAPDPMLSLIEAYRSAEDEHAQLCLSSDAGDDADEAFRIEHMEPIRDRIINDRPEVTSEAGARECIRTALCEHTIPEGFERALLKAAFRFFEDRAPEWRLSSEDMEANLVKAALAFLDGGSV